MSQHLSAGMQTAIKTVKITVTVAVSLSCAIARSWCYVLIWS